MFIGTNVNHKIYGEGIITDMTIDSVNLLNSHLVVNFNNLSETKEFQMRMFRDEKFFTTDDPEIIPYVLEQETEADKPKERKIIKYVEKPENEF